MDQAIDTRHQFNEGAEVGQARNGPADTVADVEGTRSDGPGILLQRFHAQANFLRVRVDLQDFDFKFVTDFDHIARFTDAAMRKFSNVNQPIDTAQLDESTE